MRGNNVQALAYSAYIANEVLGQPMRGAVHSAFNSAANLAFPTDFFLSLNAAPIWLTDTPFTEAALIANGSALPLMPNGVLLTAHAGTFPFGALRPGMPVLLGAGWLWIEPLACALDLTHCSRWDAHIEYVTQMDMHLLRTNCRWLQQLCAQQPETGLAGLAIDESQSILDLAQALCGCGPGLTPGGDDFLAGWMATGWLLYGPKPAFLERCQQIVELARQRTHALSRYWLSCAASGHVVRPVGTLLNILPTTDRARLEGAAHDLLALGATSGEDMLRGIIYALLEELELQP